MTQDTHKPRRRFFRHSTALSLGALASSGFADRNARASSDAVPESDSNPALPPPLANGQPDWQQLRHQFTPAGIDGYLNNGSLGPMPRSVTAAINAMATELAADPRDYEHHSLRQTLRQRMAQLVGADSDEIALTRSTTEGMNILAHGLDWRPGDEVILSRFEHPGAADAYRSIAARHHVQLRFIDLPGPEASSAQIVDLYQAAIGPRTRVIVVSHLVYVTGLRMPVAELAALAHRHGVLLSVDGAHPLGMLQLDLHALGCDHYAASGQKWLLGGPGTGICYLRRGLQDQVWPLMGYHNPEPVNNPPQGASRYEHSGQKTLPALAGMLAAARLIDGIGQAAIEQRALMLATKLRTGLDAIDGVQLQTPLNASLNAALTSFSVGLIPNTKVARVLREQAGLYLIPMPVGDFNAVRASTHFYNTSEQIDRLLHQVALMADNELDFV